MRNILFILATLMFCSCQTKQDPIPKDHSPNYHPLIGKWSLVAIHTYSPTEVYEEGSIIWEFDTTNKVKIEIKIELPKLTSLPTRKGGVFPFTLRQTDRKTNTSGEISIEGMERWERLEKWSGWCKYRITDQKNELLLDFGMASDSPGFSFKRAK